MGFAASRSTVTSEERVLTAILMQCMRAMGLCGWEMMDELLESSTANLIFQERFQSLSDLSPFVRFVASISLAAEGM